MATLIDRHSRKKLLILVQILQSTTALVVAIAYWLSFSSIWLLAAAQMSFWISSNLAWSTNNAFTQEHFEPSEYAKISGYQEVIMQGTTLGAGAAGIFLLQLWGVVEFSLFAAFASAISAISYIATPYRRQLSVMASQTPFAQQLLEIKTIFAHNPNFYIILMMSSLTYPLLTFLGKLIPIIFSENNVAAEWYAGYNVAFGLGSLLTGLFIVKLLTLSSHINLIAATMLVVSASLIGMSLSNHPTYLLLFTLIFGSFNALNRIARTNWMHLKVAVNQRGRVDGGLAMFATFSQSVFYVVIALMSHYQTLEYGFMFASLVAGVASLIILFLSQTDRGKFAIAD